MYDLIREHKPQVVILDPITDFFPVGNTAEVKAAMTRIIDFFKTNQITATIFTSYTEEDSCRTICGGRFFVDRCLDQPAQPGEQRRTSPRACLF